MARGGGNARRAVRRTGNVFYPFRGICSSSRVVGRLEPQALPIGPCSIRGTKAAVM